MSTQLFKCKSRTHQAKCITAPRAGGGPGAAAAPQQCVCVLRGMCYDKEVIIVMIVDIECHAYIENGVTHARHANSTLKQTRQAQTCIDCFAE